RVVRQSSAASSGSWLNRPSGRSSRLSSCPTAASASRRTRAAAVPISGFVSDGRSWSRPPSSGGQEQNSLIGLTSFITRDPPMLPKLNRKRSEEHTSELQSRSDLVCRLLLEKK